MCIKGCIKPLTLLLGFVYKFQENVVGGLPIMFHRFHEKHKTRIRGEKICKRIWGADPNALYLWALSQPMPTGYYARRRKEIL